MKTGVSWRRRLAALVAAMMLVAIGVPLGYAAAKSGAHYNGANVLATSGQVSGVVTCGEEGGPSEPRGGISVWMKGTAFTAHTDDDGTFVIDYVPAGAYDLAVTTSGRHVRAVVPVVVEAHTVANVGTIAVTGGCGGEGCGGGGGGGGGGECSGEGEHDAAVPPQTSETAGAPGGAQEATTEGATEPPAAPDAAPSEGDDTKSKGQAEKDAKEQR